MSLNRFQSESRKHKGALKLISDAGIQFKVVRFNAFHIICKPEGKKSIRYFPHTGILQRYNGRSGVTKTYLSTAEKFIDWYRKYET